MSLAKHWIFTLNNPTDDEQHNLYTLGESIAVEPDDSILSYLIFGDEVAPTTGTPHLQGYLCLREKKRLSYLKTIPGLQRACFFVRRGTHSQASDYCKKEGSFHEWGEGPTLPGAGGQFEQLRAWIASQEQPPTIKDVWEVFPALAARYRSAVLECIALFGVRPNLVGANPVLRPWQHAANARTEVEAHPRHIFFYVDPEGNKGKSFLTQYWLQRREDTQFMSIGKRDDLAYAVDVNTSLFVFDIPRGNMQYMQYGILEMLKNRVVFSNKYMSQTKVLNQVPHVVVFCNEQPDMNQLSRDRYKVITI